MSFIQIAIDMSLIRAMLGSVKKEENRGLSTMAIFDKHNRDFKFTKRTT